MFIGIDTSNYTTSIAAYDGENIFSQKKLLKVPLGKIGMRQSECVFFHIQVLSEQMEALAKEIDFSAVTAIGVSTQPRRSDQSYMPVFMAGYHLARSLAAAWQVPLYTYSHQEGHIMAALLDAGFVYENGSPFLFLHLSGGTTEWLRCSYQQGHFLSEIAAATEDISAGQLLDRVGVKMGLPFPSGPYIESLAHRGTFDYELPIHVKDNQVNFSGCEAEVTRILERENYDCSNIAYSVLQAVSQTLIREFDFLIHQNPTIETIVIAGGVASCEWLRETLEKVLHPLVKNIQFAKREYSSDNAVGIAALALKENRQYGK